MSPARSCVALALALALALMVACGGSSRSSDKPGTSAGSAGKASPAAGAASGGSSTSAGTGGAAGIPGANSGGRSGSSAGGMGQSGNTDAEGGASGAEQGGEGGEAGAPDACEPVTDDQQCIYDRQMTLTPATVTDEDEDGLIEPGEKLVIHSELHNPGPLDHSYYPGVVFTTSHPELQPSSGNWHDLFGMSVGQSHGFELELELSPDAVHGSTISITIVPSGINADPECCGRHPVTLELPVE